MTDRPKNPNDLPDDDWAMSEPEVPVNTEPEAKPIDEAAAKLYSPPDSGDLKEWDLETKDIGNPEVEAPEAYSPAEQSYDGPAPFSPPRQAIETLKPIIIDSKSKDDWEMREATNDGWKMPPAVFRESGGRVFASDPAAETSEAKKDQEAIPETLSGIYSPPETGELEDSEDTFEGVADPEHEPIDSEPNDLEEDETELSGEIPQINPSNPIKKRWSILFSVLFIGTFLLVLLALAVFVAFYYSTLGLK